MIQDKAYYKFYKRLERFIRLYGTVSSYQIHQRFKYFQVNLIPKQKAKQRIENEFIKLFHEENELKRFLKHSI